MVALKRRHFLGATVMAFAIGRTLRAWAAADPKAFLDGLVQRAIGELTVGDISLAERASRVKAIFLEYFDMPAVAKYVLGGYWRQASEEQRKVFVDTFIEYMSVIYAKRFLEYSGQKLHVDNVRQNGPDMSTIYTTVENPNSQDNPRIDWVVRPEGDRWRILDVKIEGLSLTETHRNEFSAVIAHSGGIDGLIKTLQAKIQTDLAQKQ